MDAVALDLMLPEYQECREEAANYVPLGRNNRSPSPIHEEKQEPEVEESPGVSNEDKYEEQIGSGSTELEAEENLSDAVNNFSGKVVNVERGSTNSSIESYRDNSSRGRASIYHPSAISPCVKYDRDTPQQNLVAVFGREFDMPETIVRNLQKLVATGLVPPAEPSVKFVPFTLKRKTLLKGTFDSSELLNHDLICMCYNGSEARILLTGTDGFYTSLLRHTEVVLGPNKVAFIITNYRQPGVDMEGTSLVCPPLKTRLARQEALIPYLDNDQVLSWTDSPASVHLDRLTQLAELEKNPRSFYHNQSCVCL